MGGRVAACAFVIMVGGSGLGCSASSSVARPVPVEIEWPDAGAEGAASRDGGPAGAAVPEAGRPGRMDEARSAGGDAHGGAARLNDRLHG